MIGVPSELEVSYVEPADRRKRWLSLEPANGFGNEVRRVAHKAAHREGDGTSRGQIIVVKLGYSEDLSRR